MLTWLRLGLGFEVGFGFGSGSGSVFGLGLADAHLLYERLQVLLLTNYY
jgi:hypothetical protein